MTSRPTPAATPPASPGRRPAFAARPDRFQPRNRAACRVFTLVVARRSQAAVQHPLATRRKAAGRIDSHLRHATVGRGERSHTLGKRFK
ncbi:hypothetical protein SDC9_36583 [bioreactor metagenome]|uniref:Uncharacterized protein n=1 Tax=bioreactor metagenome TaxID=1076179 RepID=A0A644VGX7_9ZZZZ